MTIQEYTNIGWLNDWLGTDREPEAYKKCHEDKSHDGHRHEEGGWSNHTCWCDICKIEWHYDSSD